MWFQLAQLVKSLVVEQGIWVQIPSTPKTDWCLDLIVRAIIMNGYHKFKCYYNYQKKKKINNNLLLDNVLKMLLHYSKDKVQ